MVDASALRDIRDASAYENYALPKLYIKQFYCIEAAVHQRIVRVRSVENRRIRENPQAKLRAEMAARRAGASK
jgi:small subunit ribosomal protein S26e